jgi:hypothetical protein
MSDMMKQMKKGGRSPFGGLPSGMAGMPQLPPGMFPGGRR